MHKILKEYENPHTGAKTVPKKTLVKDFILINSNLVLLLPREQKILTYLPNRDNMYIEEVLPIDG